MKGGVKGVSSCRDAQGELVLWGAKARSKQMHFTKPWKERHQHTSINKSKVRLALFLPLSFPSSIRPFSHTNTALVTRP